MRHLIDTRPRVATCNRCSGVVLACMSSGLRAAVDPAPLDFAAMRQALVAGHHVYRMYVQGGRPTRLEYVTVAMLRLPAAPYGTYAAAHGCGCHHMDVGVFEEPQDPSRAPASALSGSQGLSDATGATPPRSEAPRPAERRTAARCARCRGLITPDEDRFMIEWPVWTTVTHKTRNRGSKPGFETTYEGWGSERWAIHETCQAPDGTNTNGRTKLT